MERLEEVLRITPWKGGWFIFSLSHGKGDGLFFRSEEEWKL